jgi:chaperonin cofactor prefoldin
MNSDQPLNLDAMSNASDPDDTAPRPAGDRPRDSRDPIPLSLGTPPARSPQPPTGSQPLEQRVADLRREEQRLIQDIEDLKAAYTRTLRDQVLETQRTMGRVIQDSVAELEQRKQTLQRTVEQLERRQERITAEMRSTFAGSSQELAVRVQGFKDYLVGSLQDLATAAEQIQLSTAPPVPPKAAPPTPRPAAEAPAPSKPQVVDSKFQRDRDRIQTLLDRYRTTPDYYGPPWQLRRTFEPVHADRVSKWFFEQGGRGALRTMGSRLQNILISSAIISVLSELYGDRVRALVLANSPERLGEWRRGLQDCLGISRGDFGADQGVVLFEAPDALAQRADRIARQGGLPLILIDEAEESISLSILEFPLWLAFAPDPNRPVFY